MMIAIPNTLLEPVGIPWFVTIPVDVESVIDEIKERFDGWEQRERLPTADKSARLKYSVAEVKRFLQWYAAKKGAINLYVSHGTFHDADRNGKLAGYLFSVWFRVPGSRKRHSVSLSTFYK